MSRAGLELKVILTELERRRVQKNIEMDVRDDSFKPQDAFVTDKNRAIAAFCTRRAGKSNGLAFRFIRTMLEHPNCFCPYVALTRESAKNIMWPVLEDINKRFNLGGVFTESNLTMTLPNQSRLQLFGADMKNFIRRLKGIKTPGAGIDEAQDFGAHLEQLVDDVLGPAILDYKDGWLALTGTPGPVPHGYFYDITEGLKHGYSIHRWSLFDNPYLPDPHLFVNDLIKRKAWTNDNPTLQREYYGKWVMDLDALVIKYQASVSSFDDLPISNTPWNYIIGVDIGFDDADAISVIGYNEKVKSAFLIEEQIDHEQGITELANKLDKFIVRYNPDKIVMDTGGLGKKIAEEMRKRYSLPILAAEKSRKAENIELLNDALRQKKLFIRSSSRFAEDAKRLKWDYEASTPDKLVISDSFHSDIIDSVLYAFRESYHWLYKPEVIKPKIGTPEWQQKEVDTHIEVLERSLRETTDDQWAGENPWGDDVA